MKIHFLFQGSPEWLAYRAQHFNASDAPAMMGCSPYKTRAQLLREMHTGVVPDVDAGTQKRYDNGHRVEALARPLAEEIIGEELYPVVGSLGRLSASFDGLTMAEDVSFEHKALNDALRTAFSAIFDAVAEGSYITDACRLLPLHHRVQMEQQLHVSGAERVLFMASEWNADGELVEKHNVWYYPDAELRAAILRGWDQFASDLAAYVLEPLPEKVVAAPVETLPAVAVRMDGALVVQSNLPAFGAALHAFVERIPKQPTTDQQFADTEAACKALKRAEEALDAAEANALASLSDVETMRRLVADFRDLARTTRLASEKMVDRRKLELKEQAVAKAREALDLHVSMINAEIAPMRLQMISVDWAGAVKGKRSITSMQDALDTALAGAKIEADSKGRAIRANIDRFKAIADGCEFLFSDLHALVHKAPNDFGPLVAARVVQHRAAEAAKIAAAEQRAREQEAARIAAAQAESARLEALAVANRERIAREATEAATRAAQQAAATQVDAQAPQPAPAPAIRATAHFPKPDEPASLALGVICSRLGMTVNAAFLADVLHILPAKTDKAAKLYTETQFQAICRQIVSHVGAMAELYAGETA